RRPRHRRPRRRLRPDEHERRADARRHGHAPGGLGRGGGGVRRRGRPRRLRCGGPQRGGRVGHPHRRAVDGARRDDARGAHARRRGRRLRRLPRRPAAGRAPPARRRARHRQRRDRGRRRDGLRDGGPAPVRWWGRATRPHVLGRARRRGAPDALAPAGVVLPRRRTLREPRGGLRRRPRGGAKRAGARLAPPGRRPRDVRPPLRRAVRTRPDRRVPRRHARGRGRGPPRRRPHDRRRHGGGLSRHARLPPPVGPRHGGVMRIHATDAMPPRYLTPFAFTLLLGLAACSATRPPDASPEAEADTSGAFEPYDEVVTADAETDVGLFTVHRLDGGTRVLLEVPDSLLGRELLVVSRIARTAENLGYGGEEANTQVVRWERHGKNVLLRTVGHNVVAADSLPIYQAVRNATFEPIVASFPIQAMNGDSSAVVIDVTGLYTKDTPMLGIGQDEREEYGVRRLDPARSFVTRAAAFPENVEV